jgi:integrase
VEQSQKQITRIDQLIDTTYQKLEELNYSKGSLKRYRYSFKLFKAYALKNELEYYTFELALAFLEECGGGPSQTKPDSYAFQDRKRAVAKLDEMYQFSTISSRKLFSKKEYIFKGCLKESIGMYLLHQEKILSPARVKSIKLYLERFSAYIATVPDIKIEADLTLEHILGFIKESAIYTHATLYATIVCTRRYIQFLEENDILIKKLSHNIPRIPKRRDRSFIKAFTKEETTLLLKSITKDNTKERRDYAMILLAARIGLRSSDIVNLKFNHIDWETSQITLVQQKTKTPITLPLQKDVGEAIINYIKNGRPEVDIPYIFIRENPPYTQLYAASLYTIVDGYLKRAKIKIPAGRKHGPHALRHSLATRLLENNISISTIKEILSHQSTQTTKTYLKIAQAQLLQCALEVPDTNRVYTLQKKVIDV